MKSLLGTFILTIATFTCGFGNDRCNKLHSKETDVASSSTCITVIDTLKSGDSLIEYKIENFGKTIK